MYNLTEYSDNYSETSESLWELETKHAVNNTNSFLKNTKIVVPLKYLRNFWRSLEMPLINCDIHLELKWIEDCILSSAGDSAKFEITDAKLHVPIATLFTKDNVNLTKQLSNGLKRSVYWNNYQTIPVTVINQGTKIYELLSASFQDFCSVCSDICYCCKC